MPYRGPGDSRSAYSESFDDDVAPPAAAAAAAAAATGFVIFNVLRAGDGLTGDSNKLVSMELLLALFADDANSSSPPSNAARASFWGDLSRISPGEELARYNGGALIFVRVSLESSLSFCSFPPPTALPVLLLRCIGVNAYPRSFFVPRAGFVLAIGEGRGGGGGRCDS